MSQQKPPTGLQRIPLGCLITVLVGAPVLMLVTFGGMFYAKGLAMRNPVADSSTGRIYEVCIGRGGCTRGYLTHHEYLIYVATQTPIWLLLTFSVVFLAFGACFLWWKRRHR